jgi:hypothetical protein
VQLLVGIKPNTLGPKGNLCASGKLVYMDGKLIIIHCISANSKTYYAAEWIDLEIIVKGDVISHKIDGKTVVTYRRPTIGSQFLEQNA